MSSLRLEKEVRLTHGKRRKTNVSVIREHYLRDDIPCKVGSCCLCNLKEHKLQVLDTNGFSHLAIPDVQAMSMYLEVFEQPGIIGCVLLQTVLTHISSKVGRKSYRRAKSLLSSTEKNFVIFSNEYHFETFSQRRRDEAMEEWEQRLVYDAGVWYTNHLQVSGLNIPIVIISPYPQLYSRFNHTSGLQVLSIEHYLEKYWTALTNVQTLLHSLTESINLSEEADDSIVSYSNYLPISMIQDNLKKGLLYSGTLKVSSYHPRDEASVMVQLPENQTLASLGSTIFIPGMNRNRAIHGDKVIIRLLPRSQWRSHSRALPSEESERKSVMESEDSIMPTGTVVAILERAERFYVATFDESSEGNRRKTEKVLVCPYDRKIPKVRISTRQAEMLRNHRILISIDSWELGSQYPNGHFVKSIGLIGDIETEIMVLLLEHELASQPFSPAMLNELPASALQWIVDETEVTVRGRKDLRETHHIMSIDPKGCEDVDDALSVRHLKNGDIELGVHIADVSYFVSPESLTDREARKRSTTVYLADRRYDMLPTILSANLCSLLSNVDRYAVSVIWKLDKQCQVKNVWYGRTLIRSRYKLAYETAQALYDGASYGEVIDDIPELQEVSISLEDRRRRIEELRSTIKSLVDIARVLRERRGGLELEGVEVRVQINDKNKTEVDDLIPKQPLEMHEIIAECMIYANHWVAKKIQSSYPTHSLLRHHPAPSQERFSELVTCAEIGGFKLDTQSNKAFASSLDKSVNPNDPEFNKVLRTMATWAMVQAQYISTGSVFPEEYHHYGLDLDLYTHFTSPIRRYADLVVHRQLLAAVGDQSTDVNMLPTSTHLHEMAQHMNRKHRSAQLAQIASVELYQGLYFSAVDPEESEGRHVLSGVVIRLHTNGVIVFSLRYGVRAPVYLRDKNGLVAQPDPYSPDKVIFDSGTLSQSGQDISVCYPNGQYKIALFDHVRVKVTSKASHAHGLSLSMQLLKCGPIPSPLTDTSIRNEDRKQKDSKKELIKTVRKEAQYQSTVKDELLSANEREYQQSDSAKSLYCTIQRMHRLALQSY